MVPVEQVPPSAPTALPARPIGREAVFGAAVGRGGRSGDAVGDDELEPGDHGVRAEDDLRDWERKKKRKRRKWSRLKERE